MDCNLKGKTVVVTGGGSGIGLATAMEFAKEGCNVAICGRSASKLDNAKEKFAAAGLSVDAQSLDIVDLKALNSYIDAIHKKYGRIDIWINNAGIGPQKSIFDSTEEDWDTVMNINLKALYFASKYVCVHMKNDGGGVIINVASYGAVKPIANLHIYGASKIAVLSLTSSFAGAMAPHNIRVVSVIPGPITTEMTEVLMKSPDYQKVAKHITKDLVLNRMGKPEELAKPIVFLASDNCSFITGVPIEISGGKLAVQQPQTCWGLD